MGIKRENEHEDSPTESKIPRVSSPSLSLSRPISACQRCRKKKIKCDQNFPKCSKCDKANVECIGLDPATGREVPRSYVTHLEDRIAALEMKLKESGVDPQVVHDLAASTENTTSKSSISDKDQEEIQDQREQGVLMNQVKFNSINAKDNRSEATHHSISFAKLMSTAVKFKKRCSNVSSTPEIELDPTTSNVVSSEEILPALLPPKKTAQEFVRVFFAQSNSQCPVLHREEFLQTCFLPIYGRLDTNITLASNYTAINMSGLEDDPYYRDESLTWLAQYKQALNERMSYYKANNQKVDTSTLSNEISVPLKFHKPLFFLNIVFAIASSTHHLQYPTNISDSLRLAALKYIDQVYTSSDQLEVLQGLLLTALYSIMRPAVPGCWYLVGSALRLCVDLGLHSESINQTLKIDSFTLDKRRRLFWCTYSLDRQISFYLSRPDGIPDEYITTRFPSELDDALIVPHDVKVQDYSDKTSSSSSYKTISISMFRVRQIQSQVQRMLFGNSDLPRQFNTLSEWKQNISKQLKSWKSTCPKTRRKMNCDFNLDFFGLNYNHTLLILHGLSPKNFKLNKKDFSKVSECAKELINIYTQLLTNKCINYTWAAVLNLFMAGTSYLYSIYNSEVVRSQNSLFEVKKITQECITVLNTLIDRCDAASTCKNTFEMLTAAVVKIKYNETVHGSVRLGPSTKISIAKGYSNNNLNNLVAHIQNESTQEIEPSQTPEEPSLSYKPDDISGKLETDHDSYAIPSVPSDNSPDLLHHDIPIAHQFERPMLQNLFSNKMTQSTPDFNTPSTFEWTSSNAMYGNELEHFFDELEKSPLSTNSRRNSYSDADLNHQLFVDHRHLANENGAFNTTPYSHDSNDSNGSSPVILNRMIPNRQVPENTAAQFTGIESDRPVSQMAPPFDNRIPHDGRKVYELIHQVPTNPIWDQFFTSGSNTFSGLHFEGSPTPQ